MQTILIGFLLFLLFVGGGGLLGNQMKKENENETYADKGALIGFIIYILLMLLIGRVHDNQATYPFS